MHRLVWEEVNGPISKGMELHHLCANRRCYRPSHLICLGRRAHKWLDGRMPSHCPKGHLYQGLNKGGGLYRRCKTCANASELRAAQAGGEWSEERMVEE